MGRFLQFLRFIGIKTYFHQTWFHVEKHKENVEFDEHKKCQEGNIPV